MTDNAPLKSQYLTQVEADLDRTAKDKDRIAADIAALQEQLTALDHDHALLLGVLEALSGAAEAGAPVPAPAAAPVADEAPAETGKRKAAVPGARKAKAAAAADKPAPAKPKSAPAASGRGKSAGKPAAVRKSSTAGTPTLRDLVLSHLTAQSEPRSAAEITTSLEQSHPERAFQTTVVRNTLEGLVAKTHAARTRQNRSVYYTAAAPVAKPAADTAAATA